MNTTIRSLIAGGAAAATLLTSAVAAEAAAAPRHKAPKIFGTSFQADPEHDFTRSPHPRRDGILRGWITYVHAGGVAEYEPIKWKKGKYTEGRFVGPPEGDVRVYASPIARNVVFLSALGCGQKMTRATVDRRTGLGSKRCPRADLIKRARGGERPALITVRKGRIVRVQEIFTP
ncbi:hypothetical protein AB0J42_04645 [Nonomuraea sp. NPDC049649]|uniref:hypothetical protein n=1 Tax=Nonomuraea sp. NPDC049649 TaxID=3155776 RepID=UPI0034300A34